MTLPHEDQSNRKGLEYERVSTVPFKLSANDVFDFPSLEVQYFDRNKLAENSSARD